MIPLDGMLGAKILVVRSTDYVGPYKGHKISGNVVVGSLITYMSVPINCGGVIVVDTVESVKIA